jgi:hypothetical protein
MHIGSVCIFYYHIIKSIYVIYMKNINETCSGNVITVLHMEDISAWGK